MAKSFLHYSQHIFITAAFRVERLTRRKADLRQSRSEQIVPPERPEHRSAVISAPCGYPGREKGRCCIIVKARCGSRHFVQGRRGEAVSSEPLIDFGYSKGQIFALFGPPDGLDRPDLGAQGIEPLTAGRG